jgi:hypothetical protein
LSLLGLALVASVAVARFWEIQTPSPEAYDVSGDRELAVFFCGSTADSLIWTVLREDVRDVVVGARMARNREVFANGTAQTITVELSAPLGNRMVKSESGVVLPRGKGFLCPG